MLGQNVAHLVLNSTRKKYVGGSTNDELASIEPEKCSLDNLPEPPRAIAGLETAKISVLAQLSHFMSAKILRKWPESSIEATTVGMLERLKIVRDLNKKHI